MQQPESATAAAAVAVKKATILELKQKTSEYLNSVFAFRQQ